MIKTKQYNDFSSYTYFEKNNPDFMYQEIETFVKNGGDLKLPVLTDLKELKTFSEYVNKEFSIDFVNKLLQNNLLVDPFDFVYSEEDKTIYENKSFSIIFLQNNYEKYKDYIKKSFTKIVEEIEGKNVKNFSSKDYYDKEVRQHLKHPLLYILKAFINEGSIRADLMSIALKTKEFNSFMKEELKDDVSIERLLNINGDWLRNEKLAVKLYEHGFLHDYFKKNQNFAYNLFKAAIETNNVNLFNKLTHDFDFKKSEETKKIEGKLLCLVREPEIAEAVIKYTKDFKETKDNVFNLFRHNLSIETTNAIINGYDKDIVKNNDNFFYQEYAHKYNQREELKNLILNHGFPTDKYDLIKIFHRESSSEDMKWAIENGIDPRNCKNFMEHIVARRAEGKKALVRYKKEGLLDPFSPDMLYNLYSQSLTSVFTTYYDKVTPEQLSKYTKDGKPAWWGGLNSNYYEIKDKIKDFNQESTSKKGCWLDCFLSEKNFKNARETLNVLTKVKSKLGKELFNGAANTNQNFLHNLLNFSEYRDIPQIDLIRYVFENTNANWPELINQKNENNQYPFINFFYYIGSNNNLEKINDPKFKKDKYQYNEVIQIFQIVLDHAKDKFPYHEEIGGVKVIDLINEIYPSLIDHVNPYLMSYTLNKSLDGKEKTSKLKI